MTSTDDTQPATTREQVTADMPVMVAALTAQRLQLEQLAAGGVDVGEQLTGLRLVEAYLPALVRYVVQLEGVNAGLSALKSPPDLSGPLEQLAAVLDRLSTVLAPQQPTPPPTDAG